MKKLKKNTKIKEPVRLRAKKLTGGSHSLYLDTYIGGKRSYEFLRLYLIPENTAADKVLNETSLKAANAIKAERTLAIIRGMVDMGATKTNYTVDEWIAHIIKEKSVTRTISSIRLMNRLAKHLDIYLSGAVLGDIDRRFCIGFADYLRTAQALNSKKILMQGTQFELFNALSIVLNEAERTGLIPCNPLRQLKASERIKKPQSNREYLTSEEVGRMIEVSDTHIAEANDVAAFLFCCFCGLRYSDVKTLQWSNIIDTDSGKEIRIVMKKTHRQVVVPLSDKACELLPSKGNPDCNVFTFPTYGITLRRLKRVSETARIKKKVTFHISRHTFATMMLTAGADLYTISKLMGHTDIRTTQIYSKVVDSKKREAIALLDSLF